uniref:Replication protein A 14 kDa subunit n=1 Tax=Lygus hesperus TaxID=30085 RepID=A0A0A9YBH4_LYGHE
MESSERPLVNGALLPQYIGKTVSIFGTVIPTNTSGTSFDLMACDKKVVTVSLRSPLTEPLTGVVEVHGIVKGRDNIICNYYMAVPSEISGNYEHDLVNDVVSLVHNVPNVWKATA